LNATHRQHAVVGSKPHLHTSEESGNSLCESLPNVTGTAGVRVSLSVAVPDGCMKVGRSGVLAKWTGAMSTTHWGTPSPSPLPASLPAHHPDHPIHCAPAHWQQSRTHMVWLVAPGRCEGYVDHLPKGGRLWGGIQHHHSILAVRARLVVARPGVQVDGALGGRVGRRLVGPWRHQRRAGGPAVGGAGGQGALVGGSASSGPCFTHKLFTVQASKG
jgi:hypothetical protein